MIINTLSLFLLHFSSFIAIFVGVTSTCSVLTVLEGTSAVVRIASRMIPFVAPFEVVVTFEKYTGPLRPYQAAVGEYGM